MWKRGLPKAAEAIHKLPRPPGRILPAGNRDASRRHIDSDMD